jgi:hypothetical protein
MHYTHQFSKSEKIEIYECCSSDNSFRRIFFKFTKQFKATQWEESEFNHGQIVSHRANCELPECMHLLSNGCCVNWDAGMRLSVGQINAVQLSSDRSRVRSSQKMRRDIITLSMRRCNWCGIQIFKVFVTTGVKHYGIHHRPDIGLLLWMIDLKNLYSVSSIVRFITSFR